MPGGERCEWARNSGWREGVRTTGLGQPVHGSTGRESNGPARGLAEWCAARCTLHAVREFCSSIDSFWRTSVKGCRSKFLKICSMDRTQPRACPAASVPCPPTMALSTHRKVATAGSSNSQKNRGVMSPRRQRLNTATGCPAAPSGALRGPRGWLRQYTSRSGCSSCRMVVAISSMDFVVVDSQRMPARRIMASASATSWRQFSRLA